IAYTPFVWLFGATLAATTAVNILLYFAGAYATWSLADRLSGRRAAAVATLLFTFWPARLLMAGLAAKENLLIACVIAGTALSFKALDPSTRRPPAIALCAGIALGVAALTQPGVALLVVAVPIAYRFAISAVGTRHLAACAAAFLVGAVVTVAPWMLRNCIVFEGAFCGISTNGGNVFYRANNPSSSGSYMSLRGTSLVGLSELELNRRGYELGRQWIAEHPLDAAMLVLRKEATYLGGDDYGAYWGVLRALGGTEEDAVRAAGAQRIAIYRLAKFVSIAYWVLLAALCAQAIWGWPTTNSRVGSVLPPLFYPLLCGAAVFGIFESGDRQHMFAVAPLIVLAAAGVVQQESALRASTGGTRS
ncbi:MAG TPA: glycosyltransferase family 39 protein, partial [Casimicrobiaceae bacterium]|nr:glycosyltransferase family 39 protein [Casimicrobiaceae bacterium]